MKVKELIEKLQALPSEATVWADDQNEGAYLLREVDYDDVVNEVKLS